jgi:hypothetical protein
MMMPHISFAFAAFISPLRHIDLLPLPLDIIDIIMTLFSSHFFIAFHYTLQIFSIHYAINIFSLFANITPEVIDALITMIAAIDAIVLIRHTFSLAIDAIISPLIAAIAIDDYIALLRHLPLLRHYAAFVPAFSFRFQFSSFQLIISHYADTYIIAYIDITLADIRYFQPLRYCVDIDNIDYFH